MAQEQNTVVHRAKPSDAQAIADFLYKASGGHAQVDTNRIIEHLGSAGFLLAQTGNQVTGMLGWLAENLIVRVTDFLVWPASERYSAGRALIMEMEKDAHDLQCEAALLFLPWPAPQTLFDFCKALGYEPQIVADLPPAWQEAAKEGKAKSDDLVMVKQLRDRIVRPI